MAILFFSSPSLHRKKETVSGELHVDKHVFQVKLVNTRVCVVARTGEFGFLETVYDI